MPMFDPAAERTRFQERSAFLARHWAMALELAPGLRFQPETKESIQDQIRETLFAEGLDPETLAPEARTEAEAAFALLSPRREADGWSLTATLMLGFPDQERDARLAFLRGFPEALHLRLDDRSLVPPEVDGGAGSEGGRLPSVLALRYRIPEGRRPVGLRIDHRALSLDREGMTIWQGWLPGIAQRGMLEPLEVPCP